MAEKTKNIENLIKMSTDALNKVVDVDTVIGTPIITLNGTRVIPFTKVTVGHIAGNGEYGETKIVNDDSTKAGASGLLINIKPEGFLVDDGKSCKLLNVTDDPAGVLIEKATELLNSFIRKDE